MKTIQKINILQKLEMKSARDGLRELHKLQPEAALPPEREKVITDDASEVSFVMSAKLKDKLEEVRSLLGPKGASMGYAELFDCLADLGTESLKAKKFGKIRTSKEKSRFTPTSECSKDPELSNSATPIAAKKGAVGSGRYIPRTVKHQVWARDRGKCTKCTSRRNLNYDHIRPVAQGGVSTLENLRLLCFHCNQRAAVNSFGMNLVLERQIRTSY